MGRSGTDTRNKDDTSFQDEYLWLSVFVVDLTTIAGSPRRRNEQQANICKSWLSVKYTEKMMILSL